MSYTSFENYFLIKGEGEIVKENLFVYFLVFILMLTVPMSSVFAQRYKNPQFGRLTLIVTEFPDKLPSDAQLDVGASIKASRFLSEEHNISTQSNTKGVSTKTGYFGTPQNYTIIVMATRSLLDPDGNSFFHDLEIDSSCSSLKMTRVGTGYNGMIKDTSGYQKLEVTLTVRNIDFPKKVQLVCDVNRSVNW